MWLGMSDRAYANILRRMIRHARRAIKRPIVSALARRGIYRIRTGPPDFPSQNNTRGAVDAFYSDQDSVREYLEPARLAFYRAVAGMVAQRRPVTGIGVADVGCGTGHLLALFDDASHRVGFDFSEAALRFARDVCPDADLLQQDIYDPPDGEFDVVLCCEVLEHLFHPRRALENVAQMIRPGGLGVATVPNGRIDTEIGHINFWSPESWQVFLAESLPDFEIETGVINHGQNLFGILTHRHSGS